MGRCKTYLHWIAFLPIVWLASSGSTFAAGESDRFLVIPFVRDVSTTTYDLSTVQMLQPGRFTIISTTIDNPDVMKFRLKVLQALEAFCKRPIGQYPPPPDVLTLGTPDIPITNVEVSGGPHGKRLFWLFPYKKLGERAHFMTCGDASDYIEARTLIVNGLRSKQLYDCKRGMSGNLRRENDDAANAFTHFVKPDTVGFRHYLVVCLAVTHEDPYIAE